jgi:very-short-patch-repair endonuclease
MPDTVGGFSVADEPRARTKRLFEFLRALDERRHPSPTQLTDHRWRISLDDLPAHQTVKLLRGGEIDREADRVCFFRIARPKLTPPPAPPENLKDWLQPGLENWGGAVRPIEQKTSLDAEGSEHIELFGDDPERTLSLQEYAHLYDEWAERERPVRAANELFETVYALWGDLRREGEAYELLLANCTLSVKTDERQIKHPLVFSRVQLDFDASIPEFQVIDTGHPPELYHQLFRRISDLSPTVQNDIREAFDREPVHPLADQNSLLMWARRTAQWLHQNGEAVLGLPEDGNNTPRIGECPMLLARLRAYGYIAALDAVLKDLEIRTDLPPVLCEILGNAAPLDGQIQGAPSFNQPVNEDPLFALPANEEQVEIARRVASRAGVVVQGPPGTGKTHTIANLIGHCLAQGKSVLVTSHTAKALRVLREKLPTQLQALCVSVLENDLSSREELKYAVNEIIAKLSAGSVDGQMQSREAAKDLRERCLAEIRQLCSELKLARSDEYRPVILAGEQFDPAKAARFVAQHAADSGWIPSPIQSDVPLPLNEDEIAALYASNALPMADEAELLAGIPDTGVLPPNEVEGLVQKIADAQGAELNSKLWVHNEFNLEKLEKLKASISRAIQAISSNGWLLAVIEDSRSEETKELWANLVSLVESAFHAGQAFRAVDIEYSPELSSEDLDEQLTTLQHTLTHLEGGGSIVGVRFKLLHSAWNGYLETVRVNNRRPHSKEHLVALIRKAETEKVRQQVTTRWKRQVTSLGGPDPAASTREVESVLFQYLDNIRECLQWTERYWSPLQHDLSEIGCDWGRCLAETPPIGDMYGHLIRIKKTLTDVVLPEIEIALRLHRASQACLELDRSADLLAAGEKRAQVVLQLQEALRERDAQQYRIAWDRLLQIHNQRSVFTRRQDLLSRLEAAAPGWATEIRKRKDPHDKLAVPGNAKNAWRWRQFTDDLDVRARRSLTGLQTQIQTAKRNLERVTSTFIEAAAWVAQRERMSKRPDADQALRQWVQAVTRSGGTGRQAIRLRMTIPNLMARCREAVPVWIMQLDRLLESFDPAKTRFDVVIIDEASQANLMGLLAIYLAKKVVVVGDDEQVSPDAVGQDTSEVQSLIDTYLHDFPDRNLFDPTYSLYDFATARFGNPVRLREHFRCAPEIIQFSNALSYRFEIQPLRDVSRCVRKPHVIAHKVSGAREGKQNAAEAEEIVSLIAAMCSLPEYDGASFGVISLLGDEQARLVDSILRKRISAKEYESRRIVCGNAYQFQGDERDVMLLSVVDSPGEGPLRLLAGGPRDMFKKRYNVAASRARDQLWVLYSLDPQTDLKPDDLRMQLVNHALAPNELMNRLGGATSRVESEFERQVVAMLIGRQYSVKPQWKVGAYRIDLVVEGGGKRLAIECDGDRYHPPEQLENDIRRQEILERLGWTFIRIRGSEFFRNPERAMLPVFEKLSELQIAPTVTTSTDESADRSLRDEVVRRAAEYKRTWAEGKDPSEDISADRPKRPGPVLVQMPFAEDTEDDADDDPDATHRNIADIPTAEIKAAISSCLVNGPLGRDELLHHVKSVLGFQRLRKRIKQRIVTVINNEVSSRHLQRTDGMLSLNQEQLSGTR